MKWYIIRHAGDALWVPFFAVFLNDINHHIVTNFLVMIVFGFSAERVLGTSKTLLMLGTSFLIYMMYCHFTGELGYGSSSVVWSYSAIAAYLVWLEWRHRGPRALKRLPVVVMLLLLLFTWVVITIGALVLRQYFTIHVHGMATVVGGVFCFICADDIRRTVVQADGQRSVSSTEKRANLVACMVLVSVSVLLVVGLATILSQM